MSTQHRNILEVENLYKDFGGLIALDGVELEVEQGLITGIIGPNGAGKSTLFNVVSGVYAPDEGIVRLDGEEIQGLSPPEVTARGLGRTFQNPRIFGGMTVRENMSFGWRDHPGESISRIFLNRGDVTDVEDSVQERVAELLEFLELTDLADVYAQELSGGQQKLLELGRVLITDPDLLLLDEPTAGVNPTLANHILDRLHKLNDDGVSIVLIEHDMEVIMEHADEIVVLNRGFKLASGTPAEIQEDVRVLEAYLGGTVDE